MKLKMDFISQKIDDTFFLVPVGAEAFNGIIRGNKTAAFVIDCLKEETSEETIVDTMCAKFDAPRNVIASDVKELLDELRSINALEE